LIFILCFYNYQALNDKEQIKYSLYRIERDGASQPIRFGALGSGGPNALASLESSISKLELGRREGEGGGDSDYEITVTQGVEIIRSAVRSGILNDLGSGSHVDIFTLTDSLDKNNRPYAYVNHWRERMVKSNFEKRNLYFDNKPEEKEGKEEKHEKEDNFIAEEELGSCIFENEVQHKLSSRFFKFGVNVEVLSKSVSR